MTWLELGSDAAVTRANPSNSTYSDAVHTVTSSSTNRVSALDQSATVRWAALTGVISALLTLAVAEVVSLVLAGRGNPVLAVGSLIVDIVPPGFKTVIIALFDTADKLVLFICLGAVVVVLAAVAGTLELRRRFAGVPVFALVGIIALIAVLTRADASFLDAIPTVIGVLAGIRLLQVLIARLERWREATVPGPGSGSRTGSGTGSGTVYDRRRFLRLALLMGATSVVVGAVARSVSAASAAVQQVRGSIRLPKASAPAAALPAGAQLSVPGITTFATPNADFYRIDTALQVPSIDPGGWKLRITGMVERNIEITYDELLALPLEEHWVTLACVSNEVGGGLVGNALWLGYPIRKLLERAKPIGGADMVLSRSHDGFTAGTPLAVLQDERTDAVLAVGMNGEPLPLDHGFPVRMVVPGLYGYVSATKWVVELKVTTFAKDMGYWTPRGWSALGPVKVSSRIDTPTREVQAGTIAVAGVAWAQHTGISKVEVRVDDGDWQQATLARAVSADTWLQWSYAWEATSGDYEITVRATDADGLVQTADRAPVAPDGATGLHRVRVSVL